MEMNPEKDVTTNEAPKRQYNPSKTAEMKVDASTLTALAVAALLIIGFFTKRLVWTIAIPKFILW